MYQEWDQKKNAYKQNVLIIATIFIDCIEYFIADLN